MIVISARFHRRLAGLVFAIVLLLLQSCSEDLKETEVLSLQGRTMGTSWHVKLAQLPEHFAVNELDTEIDALLEQINQLMSTYRADSELSRFNQNQSTDWQPVASETAEVVNAALEISRLTDGAFDVTVGPLVNLWGFGPETPEGLIPSSAEIQARKLHTGYAKLEVRLEPAAIKKADPDLYVDLSAIAKGYAVDRVSELIESRQLTDYMVEIGGEIRVRGEKVVGSPWRIAVEKPASNERAIHRVVTPGTGALATSGDYRNFIEQEGRRYSHTIDPTTGMPVTHQLASVSVIHPSCMFADGLATALTVLGPTRGLELARREKLAVYLIERREKALIVQMTEAFEPFLQP